MPKKRPPDAFMFLLFALIVFAAAFVLLLLGDPVPSWMTTVLFAVLLAAGVVIVPGVGAAGAVASELRNLLTATPLPVVAATPAAAVVPPAAAPASPIPPDPIGAS